MSRLTIIPQAILDTILGRLAPLFLSGAADDIAVARQAANQTLAAYNPETPDELSLAAEVIGMGMHTLKALSNACAPDLLPNNIIRLYGSAVSLSREQHKAQRKLDQLQRARRAGTQPQARDTRPEPAPVSSKIETPVAAATVERPAAPTRFPSLKSFDKLAAARLITENLRKKQEEYASQTAHPSSVPAVTSNASGVSP